MFSAGQRNQPGVGHCDRGLNGDSTPSSVAPKGFPCPEWDVRDADRRVGVLDARPTPALAVMGQFCLPPARYSAVRSKATLQFPGCRPSEGRGGHRVWFPEATSALLSWLFAPTVLQGAAASPVCPLCGRHRAPTRTSGSCAIYIIAPRLGAGKRRRALLWSLHCQNTSVGSSCSSGGVSQSAGANVLTGHKTQRKPRPSRSMASWHPFTPSWFCTALPLCIVGPGSQPRGQG